MNIPANIKSSRYRYQFNLFLTLIFCVWPFGASIISLVTFKNKYSQIIFMLFWALWGYSRILIWGHDATAWTREFFSYDFVTLSEFTTAKVRALGAESTDFLYSFFLFLMRKITDSSAILWATLSGLFTYLYIKAYYPLLKYDNKSIGDFIILILFLFFIPKTAFGVRFWFSALFFLISIVRIILYNDKRYIYLLPVTILIHFSFLLPVLAYGYYHFTRNNHKMSFLILFILLLMMVFAFEYTSLSNLFEDYSAFQSKVEGYGDISDRGDYFGSKSRFLVIDKFMYTLYSVFVLIYIIRNRHIIGNNVLLLNLSRYLLIFFVLLLSLFRFLDVLDRFTIVFTLLTILYFAYVYKFAKKQYLIQVNRLLYGGMIFWGFHLLVNFVRSYGIINNKLFYSSFFSIISGSNQLMIQ